MDVFGDTVDLYFEDGRVTAKVVLQRQAVRPVVALVGLGDVEEGVTLADVDAIATTCRQLLVVFEPAHLHVTSRMFVEQ